MNRPLLEKAHDVTRSLPPTFDTVQTAALPGYPQAWETGSQAKAGVGRWITFYNHHRPYTAHGGQPPAVVYFHHVETDQQVQAAA